ncbi:MAG: hypothetical protein AAGG07_05070 [Planctomycetota bacterium]
MMIRSALAVAALAVTAPAHAQVVFQNANDNGVFLPFSSSTAAGTIYADSGWLSGTLPPVTFSLGNITMGMAGNSNNAGTVDLRFTFNDGSPSGLVFGSGNELFATTLNDVAIPAAGEEGIALFDLSIDLPSIETLGGFNNVGWSVEVIDMDYDGDFGFQVASAGAQSVGFFTNNATFFDPNAGSWSQFAFGSDPNTGVANFVATISVPAPGAAALLGLAGIAARRRRR